MAPSVTLDLIVPPSSSYGVTSSLAVKYTNTGTTAVPAPLLVISADKANLWLPDNPGVQNSSVQVLATSPTGAAGILAPGAQGTIVVNFASTSNVVNDTINFSVGQLKPGQFIDWASLQTSMRPEHIPADAWNAIFTNFTANLGSTTDSYQAALAADATYLAQIGHPTNDVSRLLAYEVKKADGAFSSPATTSSVDTALPTPGLSLTFERQFLASVTGRYRMGSLGRGWVNNWEVTASTDAQGNVTINAGGSLRDFRRQGNGSFLGIPGDHGILTALTGGGYQLRELNGSLTLFHPDGKLNYVQDSNGNRITAAYSGGPLVRLTHSNGSYLTFSYTNALLTQVADSTGQTTTYTYDAAGQHLLSSTDEYGTTSYQYATGLGAPVENALTTITFADNRHLYFAYDNAGRLIGQHLDNNEAALSFSYSVTGGYTTTNAIGATTTVLMDDSGNIVKTIDPLGNITRYSYDARGRVTQVNGPLSTKTSYSYDSLGNVTSVTDALGLTTRYSYDAAGRMLSFTDPRNHTTSYGYDANGNLLSITYPNGALEQYSYDPLGNRTQSINARGRATSYRYNTAGQLIEATFADGSKQTYAYDSRGNLLSATNPTGTITYKYQDPTRPDLVTEVDYPGGLFLKYTYNSVGQRTQSIDQTGYTIQYTYDSQGRLHSLSDGTNNLIVRYTYDAAGRLIQKDMGNGTRTTYRYDLAGNLLQLVNLAPDHVTVNSAYEYSYDALGRVTTMTTGGVKTTYGYDAVGQLLSINTTGLSIQYTYDAAGNRLTETVNGVTTSYTANSRNEYTAIGGTIFQYDADGNLISKTDSSGTTTYTFNDQNQLTGVNGPGLSAVYTYDAIGSWNSQTINGVTTRFLVDQAHFGPSSEYSAGGNLIAHYTWGKGLTSRIDAGGNTAYYDFDVLGNTVGMTSETGSYVNRYSYQPFGKSTTIRADLPNPFTFVGGSGVMQDGSGLFHMGFRAYDPVVGQFISNDPLGLGGGDTNIRRYAGNSPTNLTDPTGLDPTIVWDKLGYWDKTKLYMMDKLMKHMHAGPHFIPHPVGSTTVWEYQPGVGEDPFPGLENSGYLAAGAFDSPFWFGEANKQSFTFEDGPFKGRAMKGYEINYYFQGMIARAYNISYPSLLGIIHLWKGLNVAQRIPDYDWPTEAEKLAATQGYFNFAKDLRLWAEAVRQGVKIEDPGPPPRGPLTEGLTATVAVGGLIWGGHPRPDPAAFTSTTVWSDGITTTNVVAWPGSYPDDSGVTLPGATYVGYATRVFPKSGAYAVTGETTFKGPDNTTWTTNVAEIVSDAPIIVNPVNFTVPVGGRYHGPIATFKDLNPYGNPAEYLVAWIKSSTQIPATIEPGPGGNYTVVADLDYRHISFPHWDNLIVQVWDDGPGPNPRGGANIVDRVTFTPRRTPQYTTSVYGQILQVNKDQPYFGDLAVIHTTDPRITSASQVTVASNDPAVVITGQTITALPGGLKQIAVQGIVSANRPYLGLGTSPLSIKIAGQPDLEAELGVHASDSTFTVNPVPVAAVVNQAVHQVQVATVAGPATGAYSASINWGDGETSPGQLVPLSGGRFGVFGSKPHPYTNEGSSTITVTVNGPGLYPPPPVRTAARVSSSQVPSLVEDTTRPASTRVADLLVNHFPDADVVTRRGIAIVPTGGNGTWQFSANGRRWRNMGPVSPGQALLLPATYRVRFIPAPNWTGQAILRFFAWNGSQGRVGSKVAISATGAGTPFSLDSSSVTFTVTPVNDAPTWAAGRVSLPPILPGASNPEGVTVQQAFGSVFREVDGDLPGIAIVGRTAIANGVWQYALYNSTTQSYSGWMPLPPVSARSALLLSARDMLRFVPSNSVFTGTVSLLVRAWDGTTGSPGGTANLRRRRSVGGRTAFSARVLAAHLRINTAPVLNPPATGVSLTGLLVSVATLLRDAGWSDSDTPALQGLGLTAATGPGVWYYRIGRKRWQRVPATLSDGQALLLPANAWLRFVPSANQSSEATLRYRAWDLTAGVSSQMFSIDSPGGASAFSTAVATATLNILPDN